MSAHLLLVEDDLSLGETLKERLQKEGYEVTWEDTLAGAANHALDGFSLVVLDVGLPDGSGFEFAQEVRKKSHVPFIFVTAQTGAEARLRGYEIGAEEYIPKPFHLKEFLMRVKHVLENHAVSASIQVGDVEIDFSSMAVIKGTGQKEFLPKRDFEILKLLIDRAPKVLSRDEILNAVWGEDRYPTNRTVDNIILRLRQALGPVGGQCIRSVRGIGYQWSTDEVNDGK